MVVEFAGERLARLPIPPFGVAVRAAANRVAHRLERRTLAPIEIGRPRMLGECDGLEIRFVVMQERHEALPLEPGRLRYIGEFDERRIEVEEFDRSRDVAAPRHPGRGADQGHSRIELEV